MNSFFDRYNLSAFERRLTVVVGLAIFLVINMVFIWPRFSEWEEIQTKMEKASQKMRTHQASISKGSTLKRRLAELESSGSNVLEAERANNLVQVIQTTAAQARLPVPSVRSVRSSISDPATEQFFEQVAYTVSATTESKPLIDFMVGISSNEDVIRVRDLDLKPEPPKNNLLKCTMTLVANYKKQPSEGTGVQRRR